MFSGAIIAAGGHTAETGAARIQHDQADLIAYGQLFITNPDLPARFRLNAPLAWPQRATFYGAAPPGTPTTQPRISHPGSLHAPRETQLSNELPA